MRFKVSKMQLTLLAPTSQNGQKHSNKFVGNLPTNCLSVFDNSVGLALKGLISRIDTLK